METNGQIAVVESHIPGRIRIRLPREQRREDLASRIASMLGEIEGVVGVVTNIITGSMLVEYDPDRVSGDRLVERWRKAGVVPNGHGVELPARCGQEWPQRSMAAENVLAGFRKFDTAVCRITRGTVDGKMAVSLLLLGTSLGRAFFGEKPRPAPWHSLLWYSYSLFMHWHRPDGSGGG